MSEIFMIFQTIVDCAFFAGCWYYWRQFKLHQDLTDYAIRNTAGYRDLINQSRECIKMFQDAEDKYQALNVLWQESLGKPKQRPRTYTKQPINHSVVVNLIEPKEQS